MQSEAIKVLYMYVYIYTYTCLHRALTVMDQQVELEQRRHGQKFRVGHVFIFLFFLIFGASLVLCFREES